MDKRQQPGDLPIPARYYARAGALLQAQGITLDELLLPLGLRPADLQQPEASLPLTQVDALIQRGLALSGRSDLGFELGRALKLSSHSIVGFGILSSPTVDYALRLAARFFRLIMPSFRMRYRQEGQHREIRFDAVAAMSPTCLNVHLEAIAVATHCELRELLQGQMPDYALYLGITEPPHAARYAELAEAHCQFGAAPQAQIRMVLPGSIGERELALADPAALQMAEARCDALVRAAVAGGRVADWTRMILRESSDGMPNMAELARSLNLSTRTLDRHLKREGISFRELSRQVLRARAEAMLAAGELPITAIAHELGYSDAANFTRAFRRETGQSPSAYRSAARP